jgi:hypothetical protein
MMMEAVRVNVVAKGMLEGDTEIEAGLVARITDTTIFALA